MLTNAEETANTDYNSLDVSGLSVNKSLIEPRLSLLSL